MEENWNTKELEKWVRESLDKTMETYGQWRHNRQMASIFPIL